jgi:glycosyltransferase involved in cell wall biosynthesis
MRNEIAEMQKQYEIIVFPQVKLTQERRDDDLSFRIDDNLQGPIKRDYLKRFLTNILSVFSIVHRELFFSKKHKFILKNWRWFYVSIHKSLTLADRLSKLFENYNYQPGEDLVYNVWMDETALSLAVLKERGVLSGFSIRLHGYDLFDERREGGYMPFREYCFRMVPNIFTLSHSGTMYLKNKYPKKNIITSYSGIYDNGVNPDATDEVFTLVSCSNFLPLKRVDRIVNVLKICKRPIKWIHFGQGVNFKMVQELAKELPKNIQHVFMGHFEHKSIFKFYRENHVDLFIHLSETEGLGMALVEAQSFGIPVLACAVGGVPEVVVEGTGVLINEDFKDKEVAVLIENWENVSIREKITKEKSRNHFKERFEAERNYLQFIELLLLNN